MNPSTACCTLLLLLVSALPAVAAEYRCRDGVTPPQFHNGASLRVASLNIAHGRGTAINQMLIGSERIAENLERAAATMRDTDAHVIALQELDVDSRWAGNFDHADWLLANSHLACVAIGLHARNWLYSFGTGLLSSLAMSEPRAIAFEPTPPTTNKGFVAATLRWQQADNVRSVRLSSVHLDFSRKGARDRQLQKIISAVQESPLPMIVMGDFNEQWDSDGSVVKRLVEEAGLVAYQPDSAALPTYKSKRLDWILVSPELEFVEYTVLEEELSDHQLVLAELRWRDAP